MNATPNQNPTATSEPISRAGKFVLICFLFFFVVIGAIALGDLAGALLR